MALPVTTTEAVETIPASSRLSVLTDFASKIKENTARAFSDAKPMAEVFDFSAISRPADMSELTTRLRKNASYFRTNYALTAAGTTALVMLLNPWSIIVLAILGAVWFYLYIIKTTPLVLGGREFSDKEKFALLAGGSLFTVFFLTSVGATIFYALGLSAIMVAAHAAMRAPDDTTLFEDEVPGENGSLAGLLSMFKPRNAVAAYAAAGSGAV